MRKGLMVVLLATLLIAFVAYTYIPAAKPRPRVGVYEVTIVGVTNTTVTVTSGNVTEELIAEGRWLLVTDDTVDLLPWFEAMNQIERGDATIVVAKTSLSNETKYVLLGLKQGDRKLVRLILIKHSAVKHLHTRTYMSIRGKIALKGEKLILLDRNGTKGIVVVGGKWVKAGSGETTWSEVADEFNVGDNLRIFCHNILVLNNKFTETFGIKFVVWGYSGAIINLDTGTTLSKA